MNNQDHDMLIKIDTKVEMLIKTVDEMKSSLHVRVSCLEKEKIEREEVKMLWKKVNNLEYYKYYIIGIGSAVAVIVGILVNIITNIHK